MENTDHIKKEIESTAPNLSKIEPRNDFSVPANYFASLSDEIQKKVEIQNRRKHFFLPDFLPFGWIRYSIGFLFILVIGYGIFHYGRHLQNTKILQNTILTDEYILDNINADEMVEYFSDHIVLVKTRGNGTSEKINNRKEETENTYLEIIDESIIIEEL